MFSFHAFNTRDGFYPFIEVLVSECEGTQSNTLYRNSIGNKENTKGRITKGKKAKQINVSNRIASN